MLTRIISISALFLATAMSASANGDIYVSLAGGGAEEIFIDGEPTGETTPASLRDVSPGSHEISVRGACLDVSQTVNVEDDRVARVEFAPTTVGGFMEVNTSPDNARVFLDNQPIGVGPYLAMEVPCGAHEVRVTALQHQTRTENFELSMGEAIRLDLNLMQSGSGAISVLVTPLEATVLLDGTRVSNGPITLDSVSSGEHRIGAMLEGYAPIDEPVIVLAGEVSNIELTLVAEQEAGSDEAPPTELDHTVTTVITEEANTQPLPTQPLTEAGGLDWRDYSAAAMVTTSFVTGYLSWKNWSDVTMVRYNKYVTENRDVDYYNDQVMPSWGVSMGLAAVSGISLLSGSYFLFYDDSGATSLGLSGRF